MAFVKAIGCFALAVTTADNRLEFGAWPWGNVTERQEAREVVRAAVAARKRRVRGRLKALGGVGDDGGGGGGSAWDRTKDNEGLWGAGCCSCHCSSSYGASRCLLMHWGRCRRGRRLSNELIRLELRGRRRFTVRGTTGDRSSATNAAAAASERGLFSSVGGAVVAEEGSSGGVVIAVGSGARKVFGPSAA